MAVREFNTEDGIKIKILTKRTRDSSYITFYKIFYKDYAFSSTVLKDVVENIKELRFKMAVERAEKEREEEFIDKVVSKFKEIVDG